MIPGPSPLQPSLFPGHLPGATTLAELGGPMTKTPSLSLCLVSIRHECPRTLFTAVAPWARSPCPCAGSSKGDHPKALEPEPPLPASSGPKSHHTPCCPAPDYTQGPPTAPKLSAFFTRCLCADHLFVGYICDRSIILNLDGCLCCFSFNETL